MSSLTRSSSKLALDHLLDKVLGLDRDHEIKVTLIQNGVTHILDFLDLDDQTVSELLHTVVVKEEKGEDTSY